MLWISFIVGSLLFLLGLIYINQLRSRDVETIDLEPNCLLTQHPIVFIHGKKTLFFFGDYWSLVPHYLREHGYEVYELRLPWRNIPFREQSLLNQLKAIVEKRGPVHILGDGTSLSELEFLRDHHCEMAQTLWLAGSNDQESLLSHDELQAHRVPIRPLVTNSCNFRNLKNQYGPLGALTLWIHKILIGESVSVDFLKSISYQPIKQVGQQFLHWAVDLAEKEHRGHI